MKQQRFETRFEAEWAAFEAELARLERPRRRLLRRARQTRAPAAFDFPAAYRRLCAQLALARERHYSSRLIDRLGALALRGHQQLYRPPPGRVDALLEFLLVAFPRLVRREWPLFWLCSVLFYGPLLLMGAAVYMNPELVYSLLDVAEVGAVEDMYQPGRSLRDARAADSDVAMFGFYIYNNIGLGFRTFAGGMLFGVGTLLVLIFNGVYIGAVGGYLSSLGFYQTFYPFVIAHGAFELTAIVLAGVAGMRLGLALLVPGRRTRLHALRDAAGVSVRLVYGVVALLLLAAFVEAFWSSKDQLPLALRYGVGAACWLLMALYLLAAGRSRRAA